MEKLEDFLSGEQLILGFSQNTLFAVLLCVLVAISSGIIARRLLFPRIIDLISKTERIDGKDIFAPRSLGWMIGFLIMSLTLDWIGSNGDPVWNENYMNAVSSLFYAGFVVLMLLAAFRLVDYIDVLIVVEGDNMAARRSLASVAESIGRVVVVVVGFFTVAGLAGVDANSFVAGLGVTGLVIALAAKDSVANMFGAISILIDQPFNVGDWIVVGNVEGEVITIGLRTTQIRSSADTMITVPNSNITNSSVENFSQRRFRRIQPTFDFEVNSDPDALKKFCDSLCKQVIDDPRSMKSEDSWIRVKSFAPSMVIVATNFYCMSSAATQREFTEDILLMARARAKDNQLNFHEPRRRDHKQL